MRRVGALICAVVVVGLGATAPSALAAGGGGGGANAGAEALCKFTGGTFLDVSPVAYACLFPNATTPQRRVARALCVNRDRVVGFVDVSPLAYACLLPGSARHGAPLNLSSRDLSVLALLRLR